MKIRKSIFSIILLLIIPYSHAQNIVGKVIDSETLVGIPYVNMGIKEKSVGTISNKDGAFVLKVNDQVSENEEVVFSHIGYESQVIKIADLLKKNTIVLETNVNDLDEVIVDADKRIVKKKTMGKKRANLVKALYYGFYSGYEHDVVDDALGKETGMHFNVKRDCKIEKLNFYIFGNQYKSLKFRVNFYEIENGLPGNSIFNENIIFEVKDGVTGWFGVDLEEYNLYLDKELNEIAITIQWIESEKMNAQSKFFSILAALSSWRVQYIRNKSMDKWEKQKAALNFNIETSCFYE